MSEFLDPLSILRNVHRFQLVEVNGVNFPLCYDYYNGWGSPRGSLIRPRKVPQHLADQIKLVVEGDSPLQLLFEMSQRLLKYAQSFETNKNFRIDIDPDRPFVENLEQANSDQCSRLPACLPGRPLVCNIRPFNDHPVEHGLRKAHYALSSNNKSDFKLWRSTVVMALEGQFQRLSTAALSIAGIIKQEKRKGAAFNVARECCDSFDLERIAELTICFEDYAKAFLRDMPHLTRSRIWLIQSKFDTFYSITSI
jgi:hypothetical protein